MAVTKSGTNVTIANGVGIIKGRAVGEDSSTTLDAGTTEMYCKLVIEIDLDKINTSSSFLQASYKILKSSSAYPSLTQDNIIGTNAGVYQYELARFRTGANGITDFQDKRTFLDIPTIYEQVVQMVQDAIDRIEDGSAFALKTDIESVVLYENENGSSTTITLNDDVSNYKRIIVEATNIDESSICIVPEIMDPDGKRFPIITINTGGGYTKTYLGNSIWEISGDTITKFQNNALTTLNKNGATEIGDYDNVAITKVIGYKY
jgi:hypothetical protein